MLHGRKHHTLWADGANDYKASYTAQSNFVKPNYQSSHQHGGQGSGAQDGGAQGTYSWPKATPLFADGIFMQTVEPEEVVHAGPTHLLPMPSPVAPSTNEIMHALMRRKRMEEERRKHQEAVQARLKSNRRITGGEDVTEPTSSEADEQQDAASKHQEAGGPEEPDGATVEPEICEPAQEEPEESRLVLPVLESLIALRRRRLNAGQLPSYPQQTTTRQRQPPQVSTSGSAWAPNNSSKTGTVRRSGPSFTSRPTVLPADASAMSKEPPSPAVKSPNAPTSAVSLSQFPGPWRATRKWTSPSEVPATSANNVASGPATAPVILQDNSGSNAKAPTASVITRASTVLSPVVSLAGNEASIGASSAQSFTSAGAKPATIPSPLNVGLRAGGVGSAPNPRYISRFSPASSTAVGVNGPLVSGAGSGDGEALEPLGCSVREQRQLLREWQRWRRQSGLMIPGETDSESEEGDCEEGEDDDREDGVEMERDDGQPRRLFPKSPGSAPCNSAQEVMDRVAPAVRSVMQGVNSVEDYEEGDGYEAEGDEVYEEGGANCTRVWQRTRRITQCFDIPGVPTSPGTDSPAGRDTLSGGQTPAPAPPTPAVVPTRPGQPTSSSSGPLSPMASRRAGRPAGRVRESKSFGGSIGLPVWLQRAFGGGRGGGGGSGNGSGAPETSGSKASGSGGAATQVPEAFVARGPSQTTGSSFTRSQGAGRTGRLQSTSSGQLLIPSEAPPAAGAPAAAPKSRVPRSSDGRGSLGGGMSSLDVALGSVLAVRASPVRPPATPGVNSTTVLDPPPIATKGNARSSLDSSVGPRVASRSIADTSVRAASQGKVRFSSEAYAAAGGSLPESPLAQLLVTNSFDRRRGDRVAPSMFPKVKLM